MKNTIEERRAKGLFWDPAWKLTEGCTKVSPGCDNCWSETETVMRSNHPNEKIRTRALMVTAHADSDGAPVNQDRFTGRITMRDDNLDLPLRTKKPTVFAIWNDLFHEDVSLSFICDAVQVMERARKLGHRFLVLTKRAERMGLLYEEVGEEIPDHIWHGVTAENQQTADERIPHLLRVPGKRFLSIEPMVGPVDLENIDPMPQFPHEDILYSLDCLRGHLKGPDDILGVSIDAVLLGGESGKNARPMHPDWARSVRDQCEAAGVPFYFKQWGEWVVGSDSNLLDSRKNWNPNNNDCLWLDTDGRIEPVSSLNLSDNCRAMIRIGKKKAGRRLDGKTHDDLIWRNK